MELLKTLKLTQYQRNNRNNPALERRIKLVARISEQIELAENPNYKSHSVRTVVDDNDGLRTVEVSKRVLLWWRVGVDGTVELTVRYGSRVLELAKGMDAVELASTDELVGLLEQFKAAAEQSEMDDMVAAQLAKRKRVNTQKQPKLS
uniref:Uncharacterized protein n=1 Tax=uncultured delta proteobacterium HF0010_10I05 TaxID=710822 RepID=E0XX52_9DELT|nr:hypothetical protein [uncultured delta proteobacterium HF0010_10I05]